MYDPADAPLARRAVQLVRMRGRGAVLRAEGVTDADGLVRFDARAFPSGTFHVFDKLAVRSLGTFSYPTGAQVAQVNVLLAAHPAARASSSPRTTTRRRTTPQPKSNAWVKRAVFVNRALPLWSRRNLNASAASRPRIGYQAAGPWGPPRRINATWSLARVRKMERAWNVAVLSGVEGWNGRWEGRSGLLGGARAAAARVVQEAAPAAAKPWEAIGTRLEVGKLGAEAARRRLRARQTEECATIDDSLCAVAYDLCGTGEGAVAACFDPTAGPPDVPLTVTITTTVSVASTSTSTVVATPVTVTVCT
ncbi:hypothetical protein DFJ74DRAFT_247984 [Hyaloraphidium curvatum]|nr:hypothetical protein DFJ74DRAFT_247984 [Hyaloraphidium curvatum]